MSSFNNYKEKFGNIETAPYIQAAERFLPDKIKVLFIFESPPYPAPVDPITAKENCDWSYFYKFETTGSNLLRREVSNALFNKSAENHLEFLTKFSSEGYFLIDAVNYPINKINEEGKHLVKLNRKGEVDNKEREKIIYSEAGELINTIDFWIKKSGSNLGQVRILLVKVSVYNGLMLYDNPFKAMADSGKFNVLNKNTIPFPLVPNNIKFRADVRNYLGIGF